MLDYRQFLDKDYHILIDRPLGSVHPKHASIIYSVNYGYIEGIIAEDGEEVDVYVLGLDKPVDEVKAKIIAIVHRFDDDENKLVAAIDGKTFDAKEIAELVNFQEKYYQHKIVQ